jgi:hypothetical protein
MLIKNLLNSVLWATALGSLAISQCAAQDITLSFTYSPFNVPGALNLGIQGINDVGTVSGYLVDSSGNTKGLELPAGGAVATLIDPGDTGSPSYTEASQISQTGMIYGQFYDDSITTYTGFIYDTRRGTYTTYIPADQPQYTTAGLLSGNDIGGLCGFIYPPPYTIFSALVSLNGTYNTYQIEGDNSECTSMNAAGDVVGTYTDSAGVDHGFHLTTSGTLTLINVPTAASTAGTAPCLTGNVGGTVVEGLNNLGDISGHFWDTSYNEHGFLMTAAGKVYQLDYPGAYQTAGGGVNDRRSVAGHYILNSDSCNAPVGYVASVK